MSAPLPDKEEMADFRAIDAAPHRDNPKQAPIAEAIFAIICTIGVAAFAFQLVAPFLP